MRKMLPVANPCLHCGKHYRTPYRDVATRKYCSLPCFRLARRQTEHRTCSGCARTFAFEEFPLHAGKRTRRCATCYHPKGGLAPLIPAPNPCRQCGRRFAERKPPSRMKNRIFCSLACGMVGKRIEERVCLSCHQLRPRAEFGEGALRNRSRPCQACWEAREMTAQRGVGYLYPFNMALRTARGRAAAKKVAFALSRERAHALYRTPCDFCAAPGCVFRPGAGFDWSDEATTVCCWMCAKLTGIKDGGLDEQEVLKHARAIVRHLGA